jgi:hypothetical protein
MALCYQWVYNDFSQVTMFLYFDILNSNCNYVRVVQITLEAECIRTMTIYELIYVIGVFYFLECFRIHVLKWTTDRTGIKTCQTPVISEYNIIKNVNWTCVFMSKTITAFRIFIQTDEEYSYSNAHEQENTIYDSPASTATRRRPEWRNIFQQGQWSFSLPHCPDWPWDPPIIQSNPNQGLFP